MSIIDSNEIINYINGVSRLISKQIVHDLVYLVGVSEIVLGMFKLYYG